MNVNRVEELKKFYKQFTTRNYRKGEVLIRADDDPTGFFCLTKGYVRQYIISQTGFELTIQLLKPISYFPMMWTLNDTPNLYFFEALTPVEAGRMPKNEVVDFIKDKPPIILELMRESLEDHAESLTRIEHLVCSDAYRRVISVLLSMARHFGEKNGNNVIIPHRFTQQNIATLVGVARETVSIEMVKLEKRGLVKYVDHSLFFESITKLENELSSSGIRV